MFSDRSIKQGYNFNSFAGFSYHKSALAINNNFQANLQVSFIENETLFSFRFQQNHVSSTNPTSLIIVFNTMRYLADAISFVIAALR